MLAGILVAIVIAYILWFLIASIVYCKSILAGIVVAGMSFSIPVLLIPLTFMYLGCGKN